MQFQLKFQNRQSKVQEGPNYCLKRSKAKKLALTNTKIYYRDDGQTHKSNTTENKNHTDHVYVIKYMMEVNGNN